MQEYDRYLQQAAIQARNPVNYKDVGDEWLDRLTLDGYPIRQILQSIFARFRNDSVAFGRYIARRAASLKGSKYKVKNFLPRLPITLEVHQIIPLLMDKYRISSDGAKLLLEDYLWVYQQENEVYNQLKKRGMTVLKHLEGRVNTVVFFCNQHMKSNYQRFGDFVCVDFKPIKIHNTSKYRDYHVGVFTGQDTNLQHTLFGISLITGESEQNYAIAMKQFIKGMRIKKYPQSFIVGNSQILYKVIMEMSVGEQGERLFGCLMGWHYMMDKVAKFYKNHPLQNKIIERFGIILSSLNVVQMNIKIKQLTSMLPGDQAITKFISEFNKYFVAMNQPSFIGFGIEKSNFSMLHKTMYNYLKEAEGIGFVFQQALKMQEMLLKHNKKGYQFMTDKQIQAMGIICSDELRYLRIRLEKKLFVKFLAMYRTAIKHAKIIAMSPDGIFYQVAFKIQRPMPQKGYIYTVKYSLENNCWYCNCGFIYQSGIPCAHLIKIIRKFRGSLTYYIDRRWMIQDSKFNPALINHPSELKMRPQKQDYQSDRQVINQNQVRLSQSKLDQEKPIQKDELSQLSMERGEYILDIDEEDQIDQDLHEKIDKGQYQVDQNGQSMPEFNQPDPEPEQGNEMRDEKEQNVIPTIKNNQLSQQFYHRSEQFEDSKERIHQFVLQEHVIEDIDENPIKINKNQQLNQKSKEKIQIDIHEQIGIVLQYQENQKIKEIFLQQSEKQKQVIEEVEADQKQENKKNNISQKQQSKINEVQNVTKLKQGVKTQNLQNVFGNNQVNGKRTKRRVKSISLFGPITISYEGGQDAPEHSKVIKKQNGNPYEQEKKVEKEQTHERKEDID